MRRILQLAIAFILPFRNLVVGNRSTDAPIAQISVLASGKILLDGRPATISEVKRALERMKAKSGTVWYYRESGEPPPEAIELFRLMVENQLPISLSSKADFSDYVDEEGRSHPRKR